MAAFVLSASYDAFGFLVSYGFFGGGGRGMAFLGSKTSIVVVEAGRGASRSAHHTPLTPSNALPKKSTVEWNFKKERAGISCFKSKGINSIGYEILVVFEFGHSIFEFVSGK